MFITKSIIPFLLLIGLGTSFSQTSKNLKKTVRNYTYALTNKDSNYISYSYILNPYFDPAINRDSIISSFYAKWQRNYDTASYLIKTTDIHIFYWKKTQAKVWTSSEWQMKNGKKYSLVLFSSWKLKNKVWNNVGYDYVDIRRIRL